MSLQEQQDESLNQRIKAAKETRGLVIPQEPKSKITILNTLAFFMFVAGIGLILYVTYLFVYPFKPLDVKSVSIMTPSVPSGGTLIYKIDACKNTQVTPTITRKIQSAEYSEPLAMTQGVISTGCSTQKVAIHIPEGTPAGEYTLYTQVEYSISAVRNIYVFWHTQPFTVTN